MPTFTITKGMAQALLDTWGSVTGRRVRALTCLDTSLLRRWLVATTCGERMTWEVAHNFVYLSLKAHRYTFGREDAFALRAWMVSASRHPGVRSSTRGAFRQRVDEMTITLGVDAITQLGDLATLVVA